MAGYVTQKRNLRTLPTVKWKSEHPVETYEGETFTPRNGNDDFYRAYVDGYQETTSFRSGPLWDALPGSTDSEGLPLENGNWLNASSALQDPPIKLQYDTGHTFETVKRTVWLSHTDFTLRSPYPGYRYRGPLIPNRGYMTDIPTTWFRSPPVLDLEGYGRRAIQQTIPTHPAANLATLLGEARENLPSIPLAQLIRHKGRAANTVGGEYLNVEFGWKPLIRDLQKLAQSVKDHNKILSQYRRDSDRQIRRKISIPVDDVVSYVEYPMQPFYVAGRDSDSLRSVYFKSPDPQTVPPGYGTYSQSDTISHRVWFSGAYTYHLEEGSDFLSRMERYEQLANRLLGSRLTPEVVWELSPWSWLIDWYGDIGVSISNASALSNDGLVLKYGYLMCESTREIQLASTGLELHRGTLGPVVAKFRTTRKSRIRSTPFGFGQNPADFTGRQWAILAALGLTKAPQKLR